MSREKTSTEVMGLDRPRVALDLPMWAQRFAASQVALVDPQTHLALGGESFFCDYAAPLLHGQHAPRQQVVWQPAPGILAATVRANVNRHWIDGPTLLAKAEDFVADADFSRRCLELNVDEATVRASADQLTAISERTLQRHADLLAEHLRDRSELAVARTQLDSLSDELAGTYEELNLVYQLGGGIRVNRDTHEFLRQACEDAAGVLNVRGMGVVITRPTPDETDGSAPSAADRHIAPMLVGELGFDEDEIARLVTQIEKLMANAPAGILDNHIPEHPELSWIAPRVRQLLVVPLERQRHCFGFMFALDKDVDEAIFGTHNTGVFSSVDRKLLHNVSGQVAIFLENATLFDDARMLMMGLLHSLTAAVDAKDAYTCGHSERVALLARELATAAGYDGRFCERVYMAGLLHDVGKIGVRDNVLQKPGRLTDEEFAEIKRHPEIGARILSDIPQIADLIPGVLHHHERFDGRGYPHKLEGLRIPLLGRILCLADSFDAMTSSRTYRDGMPFATALAEIKRCREVQFDPQLADVFCGIGEERLRAIIASHRASVPALRERVSKVA